MATIEENKLDELAKEYAYNNSITKLDLWDLKKGFKAGYIQGAEQQEELLKSQLPKCNAISLINYLDKNRHEGKMCFSNMECADLEKAFKEGD